MKEEQALRDILEELIITYSKGKETEVLTEKLDQADPEGGALWRRILAYWDYVNQNMIVSTGKVPEGLSEDDRLCFVVLGYGLNPDGSMQPELIGRLETALACAVRYPNAYVLCTGGGTAKRCPEATEAGRMGEWLKEHGVEDARLILEDQSRSTAENALFSEAILRRDYPQVDSIVMVSSSYHIPWGSLLFEAVFLQKAAKEKAPEIHVVDNSAFPAKNDMFRENRLLLWQTGGLLELFGSDKARTYYRKAFLGL